MNEAQRAISRKTLAFIPMTEILETNRG